MASTSRVIFLICCTLIFISATFAQTQFKPKALLLQVSKDPETLQYLTNIKQRTPLVSLTLTLDLGGKYLWTDCETSYVSSTNKSYTCDTPQCKSTNLKTFCVNCDQNPGPGNCVNNSCTDESVNTVARMAAYGDLTSDVISIQSTDGKNPTQVVSVPEFFFFCTRTFLSEDLANGVRGIAGLGRTQTALPSQFARFFNYRKIFAICLSPASKGVVFLGDGPYMFLPNINAASSLTYTPLLVNPRDSLEESSEYYIGVKSIKISGQVIPINSTLLSFDAQANGGTRISTVNPYTLLEESIYDAVVNTFVKAMSTATRVDAVAPFDVCYSSKSIKSTRMGPSVPTIDLVLQSENVYWRIYGANSMVQVSKDVMCLGFVSVPKEQFLPWHAITIGGYQLENNLLQFNVAKSTLGFSSSLLGRQTTCANFNFTSTT